MDGPLSVSALLSRFDLHRDAVLVIRDGALVPGDATLADTSTVEIRPVISGGGEPWPAAVLASGGSRS